MCIEFAGNAEEVGIEAFLLGTEHVDADGVVVVRLEELLLLAFNLLLIVL
ncbi:MAG: hypothetical protein ACTH30_10255 [Leucobacter sp.]